MSPWILAARPKTLTGAAAPVLVGGALAYNYLCQHPQTLHGLTVSAWIPFFIALFFALSMQVTANFVNDYFDYVKGSDGEDRLGPPRACAQGWIAPSAMKRAVIVMSAVSALIGLPLVWFGGWTMVLVGVACVAFCWLYTTHLSYLGLGDLLVVVFFGLVPVTFTFYVITRVYTHEAWLLGLAMGLATDCLLIVNNYRDINQDRRNGKRTLIVRIGERGGRWLYLWCGIVAFVISSLILSSLHLLIFYLIPHFLAYHAMCHATGRELNKVLGRTAANIFLFGLFTAVWLMIRA